MESKLTNNPNRSTLVEIADFLYVPTSILRLTHTNVQSGKWKPLDQYKDSKFAQVLPYIGAYMYESARLYGYYKLGEAVVKHLM